MSGLRYLVWIIGPVGLYLAYLTVGLPHFIWSYSWINNGQGYDPFAQRFYTRCTFIGPYGEFTNRNPKAGKCGWIIFRKTESSGSEASGVRR